MYINLKKNQNIKNTFEDLWRWWLLNKCVSLVKRAHRIFSIAFWIIAEKLCYQQKFMILANVVHHETFHKRTQTLKSKYNHQK